MSSDRRVIPSYVIPHLGERNTEVALCCGDIQDSRARLSDAGHQIDDVFSSIGITVGISQMSLCTEELKLIVMVALLPARQPGFRSE